MVQLLRSTSIACAALVMAAVTPATAEEYVTNFGPVGPNEPIIAALGGQRVIAFFEPDRGSCSVHTFMWKDAGADAPYSTSRVRLSLRPGQMARFDDSHMSMDLLCGVDASTLAIVAPPELVNQSAANDWLPADQKIGTPSTQPGGRNRTVWLHLRSARLVSKTGY